MPGAADAPCTPPTRVAARDPAVAETVMAATPSRAAHLRTSTRMPPFSAFVTRNLSRAAASGSLLAQVRGTAPGSLGDLVDHVEQPSAPRIPLPEGTIP